MGLNIPIADVDKIVVCPKVAKAFGKTVTQPGEEAEVMGQVAFSHVGSDLNPHDWYYQIFYSQGEAIYAIAFQGVEVKIFEKPLDGSPIDLDEVKDYSGVKEDSDLL